MGFILNLETATKNCSVCLAQEGEIAVLKEFAGDGYAHAEKLHVFIEEALQEACITFKDLDAVAVSKGPGSYTGLRIGVSAAKGLCYALNIPLISIDTLEVLGRRLSITEGVVIPMIDARRMEAYTTIYDKAYNIIRGTKAEIITEDSFSDINGPIHLMGDGAVKCRDILFSGKFIYHEDIIYPSAAQMAPLSYKKYKKSDTEDVAYFEPFYLKDFIAGK